MKPSTGTMTKSLQQTRCWVHCTKTSFSSTSSLIDSRLPQFVKEYYQLKLGECWLMDIRTDIFNNIKKFLWVDAAEQLNSLRLQTQQTAAPATQQSPTLAAFQTTNSIQAQGRGRGILSPSGCKFCQTCNNNTSRMTTIVKLKPGLMQEWMRCSLQKCWNKI